MKKLAFAAATILLVAGCVELLSFTVFGLFRERFTFFEIDDYLVRGAAITTPFLALHPERGWDTHYDTPLGERPRVRSYGRPAIATFGDSFTFCAQVKNHQTWQVYLADRLRRDVYNFGTGAYGTDQALLKFREKFPLAKTPVVVLGLITENINRVVNVYRPFYSLTTGQRMTKPRFRLVDGELRLLPNPIAREADLARLADPAFIRALGRYDYWYNPGEYPVFAFPYSGILLNAWLWKELAHNRFGVQVDDLNPRPWADIWREPAAVQLMLAILDAFVREASEAGALPLILVLPLSAEVVMKVRDGRDAPGWIRIQAFCQARGLRCFNPIEGFVAHLEEGNRIDTLYKGHLRPLGNQIVADQLAAYLRAIDALPPR